MSAPSTVRVNCRYGAPLGRPSYGTVEQPGAKLHLRGIRLDSGGYDPGGAYWGHGGWLWEAWDDAGEVYLTGRDKGRETAKAAIRDQLGPDVRFYR